LLVEREGRTDSFISLVFLDLSRRSLQKLHTIEYPFWYNVIRVNKADLNTFILTNGEFIRICKIVDKTIIIGDVIDIGRYPTCFYDKCVYGLGLNFKTGVSLFICLINTFTFLEKSTPYLRY
jgi:hypothetical protein